jgi:dihydroorotase
MLTRREFSKMMIGSGVLAPSSLGLAANQTPASAVSAAQASVQSCDLLIKGGTVIDPGQKLHAPLDVAVKGKKILAVSENFPEDQARRVVSAKNRIVTPGLIDLHVHCFDGVLNGINADHYCLGRGVTTVVDAGSTGHPMIGQFIKSVVNPSVTRVYTLVHITALGVTVGIKNASDNLDWLNPELTAAAAEYNRPAVVGIKVHLDQRLSRHAKDLELEFLKRALEAAEICKLPLMAHISDTYNSLPDILKRLRKGDVFTHCFNNFQNNLLDSNGKILPEVREARARGILFDIAEGHWNLNFDVAEKCLQQDFLPDSISSDLNDGLVDDRVFDLPTVVSKFLALGMDLDRALELVTVKPARVFDYGVELGTLKPGNEANIGIFELQEGDFEFLDSGRQKRFGHKKLVNKSAVCCGQFFVNET